MHDVLERRIRNGSRTQFDAGLIHPRPKLMLICLQHYRKQHPPTSLEKKT